MWLPMELAGLSEHDQITTHGMDKFNLEGSSGRTHPRRKKKLRL